MNLDVFMETNCLCFESFVRVHPRSNGCWIATSRSEPNWANAVTSRYLANSSFHHLDMRCAAETEWDWLTNESVKADEGTNLIHGFMAMTEGVRG